MRASRLCLFGLTPSVARWTLALAMGLSLGTLPAVQAQQTLVVAAPQVPTGFDGDIPKVATRQMIVQANESLVRFKRVTGADGRVSLDPTQIEGNLAESWTVSPDEIGRAHV